MSSSFFSILHKAVPTLCVLLFLAVFRLDTAAQQPTTDEYKPNPSAHVSELENFEQYVAYWTTEPGWRTELQLRNNLDPGELTVTPALRTADGAETALPPVTIKSGDVASLDLADAVAKSAPQLVGTYGSLVLRYRATVHRALYAAVMVRIDGRPIAFHLDASFHNLSPSRASREGIWWLPRESVNDFLILANAGDQKLEPTLTLYNSGAKAWSRQLHLGPRQTQRLSVRTLLQRSGLRGSYGGIKIDGADTAGYLDSAHLLFDEIGGFSANMKMFNHDPDMPLSSHMFGGVKEWTTRAPMLALSDPDPALGFPTGTTLQPRVFVRNTSSQLYTAHIRFNWRSATATGKTAPIDLKLKPNTTQVVDIAALQTQKLIPADAHWAAVVLSAPVQPSDLMAVAASYDQTGRYGAQTPFTDQLASHWEAGMWEVDSVHNSLVTVGNGGNKPAKAELTIIYNHGDDQYQIEQSLGPDEQMLVDFGKLIRNQIPDKKGRVLPPDLTSGAYRIRDLADGAAGGVYEGKVIVDKTYGHAAYGCGICCGPQNPFMAINPLITQVAGFGNQGVHALDSCGGGIQDFTTDFPTWWTANTSIATANKNQIHGVAAGTTKHYAQSVPMYFGHIEDANPCPTSQPVPSANTNVKPVIKSFDPNPLVVGAAPPDGKLTINGTGFGTLPTVSLPAGVTSGGQGSTDTQIVLTGVSVAFSATVGNNNVTVTAGAQPSDPAALTLDGPYHMIVQSDNTFLCSGCHTTVERDVKYQIQNFSGTNAGTTSICETPTFSGWNCNQGETHNYRQCSAPSTTDNGGVFTDGWSMSTDAYTPVGCGFNTVDLWDWAAHTPVQSLGRLTGYIHTDKISINGVVSPNRIPIGTVIPF